MPHLFLMISILLASAGCAATTATDPAAASSQLQQTGASAGVIVPPGGGDRLFLCHAPNLDITVKVGSAQSSPLMAMGTARLAPNTTNFGRHKVDEIIHFVSGRGFATVGNERAAVEPGSTMFVPRGVRHGFENSGSAVMEFVWVSSPSSFEEGIREVAVRSLEQCPRKS